MAPISNTSSFTKESDYIDGFFNVSISGVGSVESSVQLPYYSLDDIDIDDPFVRRSVEQGALISQPTLWIYQIN